MYLYFPCILVYCIAEPLKCTVSLYQEFLQQTQNQRGRVPNFLPRLRGVAVPFEFKERCQDCAWDISYSDIIVWFKLIAGLFDAEIKEDILSLEEKSLDNTVKAIEAR